MIESLGTTALERPAAIASAVKPSVLLLTSQLSGWDEVAELRARRERLKALGWSSEAVCASGPIPDFEEEGIDVNPWLDSAWLRPWAVRRFRFQARAAISAARTSGSSSDLRAASGAAGSNSQLGPSSSSSGILLMPTAAAPSSSPTASSSATTAKAMKPVPPGRPRLIHALRPKMRDAALDLAEQWGWPYYLSIHDYLSEDATIRVSKRWCRGMIVPCAELADELKTTLGVPSRLIKVVRPGIRIEDGGDCSAAAPRRPLNDGNVPVIGMAGPLAPSAGLLAFLKAAQKVLEQGFDVEFTIAGRPNAAGDVELRKRIERLRLSDRLTLVLDPALRSVFWNVLDIYCQPSQAPTTGDFLIRAMARGIPVIATQVKSLRGLIHPDGNGLSIPVNDSDALAKAMISLLRDHESARRLGANAREWALAQFDPQREARELVELYDDI